MLELKWSIRISWGAMQQESLNGLRGTGITLYQPHGLIRHGFLSNIMQRRNNDELEIGLIERINSNR